MPPLLLLLERFAYLDDGTFGTLTLPSGVQLYTVERPWLGNAPRVSCIPDGRYTVRPRPFFRGGYDAYEIERVPGRTHILFHVANYPRNVLGCIGVGTGINLERRMVTHSRVGFARFMEEMDGQEGTLTIYPRSAQMAA